MLYFLKTCLSSNRANGKYVSLLKATSNNIKDSAMVLDLSLEAFSMHSYNKFNN